MSDKYYIDASSFLEVTSELADYMIIIFMKMKVE
jgi:hypothetical protein